MLTSVLAVYLLTHLALLAWSFNFPGPAGPRLWFLRIMLMGMSYDNLVLVLGNSAVGSDWYVLANIPRFMLHAGVLPFLTLFALSAMTASAVPLATRQGFRVFCWVFTVACWAYGMWHEVLLLELEPTEVMGHARLVSTAELPPLATIATNILVIPMAFAVWRRAGWPWFFAGSLFIFLVNGATGGLAWGFIVGNGVEVVFIASLLVTERWLLARASGSSSVAGPGGATV